VNRLVQTCCGDRRAHLVDLAVAGECHAQSAANRLIERADGGNQVVAALAYPQPAERHGVQPSDTRLALRGIGNPDGVVKHADPAGGQLQPARILLDMTLAQHHPVIDDQQAPDRSLTGGRSRSNQPPKS
jgi:hypothetical protein